MNINQTLVVYGESAFSSSSATNVRNVYCFGMCLFLFSMLLVDVLKYRAYTFEMTGNASCEGTTISNVEYLISDGYDALSTSTIISSGACGSNEFLMEISETNSEYFDVWCDTNDTCNITCLSKDACTNLILYCFGSCFVWCNDANIICPEKYEPLLNDSSDLNDSDINIYAIYTKIMVPTLAPTLIPTAMPSNFSTTFTSTISTEFSSYNNSYSGSTNSDIYSSNAPNDREDTLNEETVKILEKTAKYLVYVGTATPFSLYAMIYVYHKYIVKAHGCDSPKIYVLFKLTHGIIDFWTDLIFGLILYYQTNNLFIASFCFVIVPFLMQCFISVFFLFKWKHWKESHRIRFERYLNKYEILIYLFTLIFGFYNTIDLVQSRLFYYQLFNMPLKRNESASLKKYRFINIILLENIPQIAINIIYCITYSQNYSNIVFFSLTFSILSILFGRF